MHAQLLTLGVNDKDFCALERLRYINKYKLSYTSNTYVNISTKLFFVIFKLKCKRNICFDFKGKKKIKFICYHLSLYPEPWSSESSFSSGHGSFDLGCSELGAQLPFSD